MAIVASAFSCMPMEDRDLGAAVALIASIRDQRADDLPWPKIGSVEELRARMARDGRESGARWFVIRDQDSDALEAIGGFEPAAVTRPGATPSAVYVDGPIVWGDLRREGRGRALLERIAVEAEQRFAGVALKTAVGEGNRAGAAFLAAAEFTHDEVRRVMVCRDAHQRRPQATAEITFLTPADAEELVACHQLLASEDRDFDPSFDAFLEEAGDRNTQMCMASLGREAGQSFAVGFARSHTDYLDETVWIESLYALPAWRDVVLAPLIAHMINRAFGVPRIKQVRAELITVPGIDDRRQPIFESLGFRIEKVDLGYTRRG